MASRPCTCCKNHVDCCACFFARTQFQWSKSLRETPKVNIDTISKWLESGGKKNAGEKSYKFFRERYVYDVYTATTTRNSADAYEAFVKSRCYRSLKKSEEPHYLVVKLKNPDGGLVAEAHCSCKAGSGGHCNHVFALLI